MIDIFGLGEAPVCLEWYRGQGQGPQTVLRYKGCLAAMLAQPDMLAFLREQCTVTQLVL